MAEEWYQSVTIEGRAKTGNCQVEAFFLSREGKNSVTLPLDPKRTLFMQMGMGASWSFWSKRFLLGLMKDSSEIDHLVCWNNRGFGRSGSGSNSDPFTSEPFEISDMVNDAIMVMNHFTGKLSKCNIIAVSLGGLVLQELILLHAERLSTVIFMQTCLNVKKGTASILFRSPSLILYYLYHSWKNKLGDGNYFDQIPTKEEYSQKRFELKQLVVGGYESFTLKNVFFGRNAAAPNFGWDETEADVYRSSCAMEYDQQSAIAKELFADDKDGKKQLAAINVFSAIESCQGNALDNHHDSVHDWGARGVKLKEILKEKHISSGVLLANQDPLYSEKDVAALAQILSSSLYRFDSGHAAVRKDSVIVVVSYIDKIIKQQD